MTGQAQKKLYIDTTIPLEDQIAFLRQRIVNFQLDAYEVLKAEKGEEGVELFKEILHHGFKRVGAMAKGGKFQDIAAFAIQEEHVSGIESAIDSADGEAMEWSVYSCLILDGCRQRGAGPDFCEALEAVIIEENRELLGEFAEPSRMCRGDAKCRFVLKNTLGR